MLALRSRPQVSMNILQWLIPRSTSAFSTSRPRYSTHIATEEDPIKYRRGGYHPVQLDEVFNQHYQVISKLGYGVYSTVWLVRDLSASDKQYYALKILTADAYDSLEPTFELDILKHLKTVDSDGQGKRHVVSLQDHFMHKGPNGQHLCLTMDVMGQSLKQIQRQAHKRQLKQETCQTIARHMLKALAWLHDSCQIIHTDIKPDNILVELPDVTSAVEEHLCELKRAEDVTLAHLTSHPISTVLDKPVFRLADFGVASWRQQHLTEHIQPLSLRAPEVFLGSPWDTGVDIWNLGCLIYELLQGRVMFRGKDGPPGTYTAAEDQLVQMIELFGPLPPQLLSSGRHTDSFFDAQGNSLHIKQLFPCAFKDLLAQSKNSTVPPDDYKLFERFVREMLAYSPEERPTAAQLLNSQWLSIDQLNIVTITRISQQLHLLNHRNKNQHRRSIWWRHFSVFCRQISALEQELLSLNTKPKTNVERVRLDKARPGITKRIEQRIDAWPVASWQHAFTQLIAEQPFAPLGVVLLANLAEICAVTQITERLGRVDEPVASHVETSEDIGQAIARPTTPPPKRRKKKKQAQDAIDELFGDL